MTDIYDGIARDLSDGAVQRIDENPVVREFFELPTHESAARILAEVAPHAGAWIETSHRGQSVRAATCRAPRGRVD